MIDDAQVLDDRQRIEARLALKKYRVETVEKYVIEDVQHEDKKVQVLSWSELPEETREKMIDDDLENLPIYFRAHSAGNLLVGGNEPTEVQIRDRDDLQRRKEEAKAEEARVLDVEMDLNVELEELEEELKDAEKELSALKEPKPSERDKDAVIEKTEEVKRWKEEIRNKKKEITANKPAVKPLTEKMEETLAELNAKISAPFEFGKTTLGYIRKTRRRNEYGFDEPVASKEMIKGNLCEQDAIDLVSKVIKDPRFRRKNPHNFRDLDGYFTGTPDVILWGQPGYDPEDPNEQPIPELEAVVEDVKTSWNLRTFDEVENPPEHYVTQAQVYMYLTGIRVYRLIYCLVDTPWELIEEEKKKFFFKYGGDESPEYKEAAYKLELVHRVSDKIPVEDRIKVFQFEYDEEYIQKLKERVDLAREVYGTLKLVPDHLRPAGWEPVTEPPF